MHSEEHPLSKKGKRAKWLSWPLVRGCVALVDSLVLGYKALEVAANHAFDDEDEQAETVAEVSQIGNGINLSVHCSSFYFFFRPYGFEIIRCRCIDGDFDGQEYDFEGQGLIGNGGPQESDGSRARRCEPEQEPPFSWKHDFGRPDTMIDALGAQRTLEVVTEPNEQSSYGGQEGPLHASEGQGVPAHAANEEEEPFFGKAEMAVSLVMGLVLGVGLFIFLPALASNVLVGEYEANPFAWNIIDGLMRVAIFVFYVWLIGRMKDIKRMFSYHGAEHKTIHCYEHGLELTPENARSFPRLHVRCGTAFLIMVMIIAILVYTIIPLNLLIEGWGISGPAAFALLIVVRIALMPLIAGISYEITVKWAGSHPENPLVRIVLWPGMQMQRLTTNEPDDSMLECAIEAMRLVLDREKEELQNAMN